MHYFQTPYITFLLCLVKAFVPCIKEIFRWSPKDYVSAVCVCVWVCVCVCVCLLKQSSWLVFWHLKTLLWATWVWRKHSWVLCSVMIYLHWPLGIRGYCQCSAWVSGVFPSFVGEQDIVYFMQYLNDPSRAAVRASDPELIWIMLCLWRLTAI